METFTAGELVALAEPGTPVHLSIFAPMVTHGAQTAQNPIRWTNQLRRAGQALRQDGVAADDATAMLEPARALVDDHEFWTHQGDGLAYFATAGGARWHRVAIMLPELVAVGHRFLIGPLLEGLGASGRFWVLALRQDEVRLFEASRFSIEQIELPEVPEDALPPDRSGRRRPMASSTGSGSAGAGAVFFGGGTVPDRQRETDLARYFRAVDGLLRQLAGASAALPLLLAGEESVLPIYREVSDYPALTVAELGRNTAEMSLDELHDAAWERMEPLLRAAENTAADQFRQRQGTGLTESEPGAVLDAAVQGRIEALLLSNDVFVPAPPEAETILRLGVHPRSTPDLLDQAAAASLAHDAPVYSVAPERVPGDGPAAALLRF
jgi:hypothetical protein